MSKIKLWASQAKEHLHKIHIYKNYKKDKKCKKFKIFKNPKNLLSDQSLYTFEKISRFEKNSFFFIF